MIQNITAYTTEQLQEMVIQCNREMDRRLIADQRVRKIYSATLIEDIQADIDRLRVRLGMREDAGIRATVATMEAIIAERMARMQ